MQRRPPPLTARQTELLKYLRLGLTTIEISNCVRVSSSAVRHGLERLFRRYHVHNRHGLLAAVTRNARGSTAMVEKRRAAADGEGVIATLPSVPATSALSPREVALRTQIPLPTIYRLIRVHGLEPDLYLDGDLPLFLEGRVEAIEAMAKRKRRR